MQPDLGYNRGVESDRRAPSPRADARSLPTRGRVLVHATWLYDLVQPLVMFGRGGRLNREIVDALGVGGSERVLDVGCGTGLLTAEAARRLDAGEVVGIDASGPMIGIATRKRAGDHCRYELALAEELPFDDGSFDGAVSELFFHHVPMALKRRIAGEIVRVLRPGGRVAIADIDRPWTLFGKFYACSGWVLLRQPEIKENIDGHLPIVLREAGLEDVAAGYGTLGCIRVWTGRKPTE